MSTTYELWDTSSKNLVEACESEADALAFVRAYVAVRGREHATA